MRLEFEPNVTAFPLVENELFEDVGQPVPADFASTLKSGIAAAQAGDREHARVLLTQAADIQPRSEDAWMWLASISDYPEELLAFLNHVLDINPENKRAAEWHTATRSLLAKTFVQRAAAAYQDNALELAHQCLDQAIDYDVNCESAWVWRASISTADAQKLECLERVIQINPDNEEAAETVRSMEGSRRDNILIEAKAAAVAGKNLEAIALVDEYLSTVDNRSDAFILRSHLSPSIEEKIGWLEKALEIDPDNAAARSGYDFLTATLRPVAESCPAEEQNMTDVGGLPAVETIPAPGFDDEAIEPTRSQEGPHAGVTSLSGDILPFDLDAADDDQDVTAQNPAPYVATAVTPIVVAPIAVADAFSPAPFQPFLDDQSIEIDLSPMPESHNGDQPAPFDDHAPVASLFQEGDVSYGSSTKPDSDYLQQKTEYTYAEKIPDPVVNIAGFQDHEANDPASHLPDAVVDQVVDAYEANEPSVQFDGFDAGSASQDTPVSNPVDVFDTPDIQEPLTIAPDIIKPRGTACPFCLSVNDAQAYACDKCHAILTLADIESLLSNGNADRDVIHEAVTQMEADWNLREFDEIELTDLGIGHLNLNNFEAGLKYLQEASRANPNNVILSGQINTIAIRLDEMCRQSELHDAMPKGKTILVVDDSPTVRKLISGKLEKSGHNVVCAVDGVEALERLAESLPDLVLLDITMPRMDGYEVCKHIRQNPAARDLPVVMISGKDGFFDKVRGRLAGTTGYVTKPFGPETLMKALETYLLPDDEIIG